MLLAIISSLIPNHLILLSKDVIARQSSNAISRVNHIRGSYSYYKTTSDPSHIRLCELLLENDLNNNVQDESKVIFEESTICNNVDSPYTALLQIFASSLLAKVLKVSNHVDVSYLHNCHIYKDNSIDGSNEATIQQYLPTPQLLINTGKDLLNIENMKQVCSYCINSYKHELTSSPECILFSDQTEIQPAFEMERLLPFFKENVQQAVLAWSRDNPHVITSSFYPAAATDTYSESEDSLNEIVEQQATAVIYLTCQTESCEGEGYHIPNYKHIIAQEIPRSIKRIYIVGNKRYVHHNARYASLGEDLQQWLEQLVPLANINYIVESNTAESFARMLAAQYLICRPGVNCLLPLFSTRHLASYMGPPPSWLRSKPSNVKFFEYRDFQTSYCNAVRGRHGKWILSNDSSSDSQEYKWEEHFFPACDLQLFQKNEICDLFLASHYQRLVFVGKQNLDFLKSFLGLLEIKTIPKNLKVTMNCAFYYQLEISFMENYNQEQLNWLFTSSFKKTILVVNLPSVSSNYQSELHTFLDNMDTITKSTPKKHLVFMRSNTLGHVNCQSYSKPFSTIREYINMHKSLEQEQLQNNIQYQNDYLDQVLERRKRISSIDKDKIDVELLDISLMTALRPDAHDDNECQGKHNCICLNYNNKRLFDWWNYFFLNNLQDIVEDRK